MCVQCDQLRDEIAVLKAQIADMNGEEFLYPSLHLTRTERRFLAIIDRRQDLVTYRAAHAALYGHRSDGGPLDKMISVLICKLRRKLQGTGITIETVWGQGFRLPEASRRRIAELRQITEAA